MSTRENIRLIARAPSFIIVSLDERNSVQGNNFHNCMQTDWFCQRGGGGYFRKNISISYTCMLNSENRVLIGTCPM